MLPCALNDAHQSTSHDRFNVEYASGGFADEVAPAVGPVIKLSAAGSRIPTFVCKLTTRGAQSGVIPQSVGSLSHLQCDAEPIKREFFDLIFPRFP